MYDINIAYVIACTEHDYGEINAFRFVGNTIHTHTHTQYRNSYKSNVNCNNL